MISIILLLLIIGLYREYKSKNSLFIPLIFLLFISQLFLIVPGSDISAASYGNYNTYEFLGMSYSSIISIITIVYCLFNTFIRNKIKIDKNDILFLILIIIFNLIGLLNGGVTFEKIEMCAKINMPFVVYFYLTKSFDFNEKNKSKLNKLFLIINLILILQVPICKLITGKFSASTFYWYVMPEEYYGFYSSPHAFAAILGLFSLWNLKNININNNLKLNLICLICNILLIFLSGVRTYVLSLGIALILLFIFSFRTKKLKTIKQLGIFAIIVIMLFSYPIIKKFANSRFSSSFNTVELTSGRIDRWQEDLKFFTHQKSEKLLLGNGFKAIYNINNKIIYVYINSLNVILDLLIDHGILGLFLMFGIYSIMLFKKYGNPNKFFAISMVVYVAIGCFMNNLLPYITVMTTFIIFLKLLEVDKNDNYNYEKLTLSSFNINKRNIYNVFNFYKLIILKFLKFNKKIVIDIFKFYRVIFIEIFRFHKKKECISEKNT